MLLFEFVPARFGLCGARPCVVHMWLMMILDCVVNFGFWERVKFSVAGKFCSLMLLNVLEEIV